MDIKEYRDYVVNTGSEMIEKSWRPVLSNVPVCEAQFYRRTWYQSDLWFQHTEPLNHPLVNSGDAYWTDDKTLCLGYKLKNNETIFRPIFCHKRQDLINNFQKDISKLVLKREKCMNYIEFYRIRRLPKDILYCIFDFY
jgi:hypothetical protein